MCWLFSCLNYLPKQMQTQSKILQIKQLIGLLMFNGKLITNQISVLEAIHHHEHGQHQEGTQYFFFFCKTEIFKLKYCYVI